MATRLLLVVGIGIGAAALLAGLDYYLLPVPQRPFSPLHEAFAPTGLIGQGYGIVGTGMILFGVVSYGARKRIRWLRRFGSLGSWLHFHIFLCLLGPFLVLLHTTFRFGGVVAIAFWSMALVVGSGVFGRWVYVWIPKTANGRFVGRDELRKRIRRIVEVLEDRLGALPDELLTVLDVPVGPTGRETLAPKRVPATLPAGATGSPAARVADEWSGAESGAEPSSALGSRRGDRRRRPRERGGMPRALMGAVRFQLGKRRARAHFHEVLSGAGIEEPERSLIVSNLEEERRIERQLALLDPFQAAFRYWHAFHLPLAIVMLLVLVVHVGVAIAFGYTWIWGA